MSNKSCFANPHRNLWEKMQWHPSSEQLDQFLTLQSLLNHFNSQVNLTRLVKDEDYWINQVFDSLWHLRLGTFIKQDSPKCIDVGTGCGFPGLAVAIALPNARVTLVDSIQKKTSALKKITEELGLTSRVLVRTERAESIGHNPSFRGTFDLAMARALGAAPIVAEYLIPLINPQGKAILFRGKWSKKDQHQLDIALNILQANVQKIESLELPANRGIRHIIRLESKSLCPESYPRAIGIPTKKPLGS